MHSLHSLLHTFHSSSRLASSIVDRNRCHTYIFSTPVERCALATREGMNKISNALQSLSLAASESYENAEKVMEAREESGLEDQRDLLNKKQNATAELKDLLGQVAKLTNVLSSLEDKSAVADADTEIEPLTENMTGETDDTDDEIEYHSPFQESVYALIYLSSKNSHSFLYALGVILFQLTTILLTLTGIIDWHSSNPLKIPPMVNINVTCSQAFGLFLALAYQSDLIRAVLKLHNGYYPELLDNYPHATFLTWLLSCVLQLIAGLLLLTTIFVLTMQASDVISIMLNFAALHFMSEIDDMGFALAKWGFLSDKLQQDASAVTEVKVPKQSKGHVLRRVFYLTVLIGLFAGYGFLKRRQLNGYWMHTYLYVQFGEGFDPTLTYYSGIFASETNRTSGHRKYYDTHTNTILLSYCDSQLAWTFSKTEDPCDFFAQSAPTGTFDVTSILDNQWLVRDTVSGRFVPFDSFTLIGRDCDPNAGICKGTCLEGLCHCPPGTFGHDCEFQDICPELSMDGASTPFPIDPNGWTVQSHGYEIFRDPDTDYPLSIFNFPVFYTYGVFPANYIFFAGRRWVLGGEALLVAAELGIEAAYSGENYANITAHALKNLRYTNDAEANIPFFFSDEVDFHTPDFKPSPAGLSWYSIVLNDQDIAIPGNAIETVLECQSCLSAQDGSCDPYGSFGCDEGVCLCRDGYTGNRCDSQVNCYDQDWPCYGEGICDQISGSCRCNLPFYGKLCDRAHWCIEEQGKCTHGGICDQDICICPDPATSGKSCEKVNHCSIFGCSYGGRCEASTGICSCDAPFYGVGCDLVDEDFNINITSNTPEIELIFCTEDDDCQDGQCEPETGLCQCSQPNLYGSLCQFSYNCTIQGCINGATCTDNGHCDCQSPFSGNDCSELPDCRFDADCLNNGICNSTSGVCACESYVPTSVNGTNATQATDTFATGKLCERSDDCRNEGADCFHGGSCSAEGYCSCPTPYTGPRCDLILDYEG